MDVDDDVEDDDMDFNPFLMEGSPSATSSSLTSDAECEETSFEDQVTSLRCNAVNGNTSYCAPAQKKISDKGACKEKVPESTSTQLYCENGEGHANGLGKEPLKTETSFPPSVQNSHPPSLKISEEDAICRRTRARYSLANYALEELETFLQESDDDGDPQNVDEEEEYRKFLAAVLSGEGDATQAYQGDETQDEDENDADFELEIEEALESDGDENVEKYEKINGRKKRPLTRAANCRQESTRSTLRPILPNMPSALRALGNACGRQYPSQNINVPSLPSSVTGAAVVYGFTDAQLGQLHMSIYEHVQLMIQTFSLCVLDPSKQRVAADVKQMIVELLGCRDQALARRNTIRHQLTLEPQHLQSAVSYASSESSQCQWIPSIKNPIMSILDVSPLHLAHSYLSDTAAAVVKHRRSHVDGTADNTRSRKEPLFPLPVLSTGQDANNVSQDGSNNVSTASPASPRQSQPKKTLAATLVESTKKESIAPVPFEIATLTQRFYPLFNISLFPHKPPPATLVNRVLFTDAEDGLLALGILEYNNNWGAIQKRFLPCKSTHQIFVRQKNRSSSNAHDNPIKDVRRMKTSPLSTEEVQRIEEIFKTDWTSLWKFLLPYRDPTLLQRQWRVATGVQRSYSKSDAVKEKRRTYEAKRRKLRASVPDSPAVPAQEADDAGSEGVENDDDDDSYVNEAFLADTENRSINMMQRGTSADDECGAAHSCFEQHNGNSTKHIVSTSYTPFSSCASDGLSTKRLFRGTLNELQALQMGKEKGSHVVKLAPDLPALNLPPSVRVMSQREYHQNAAHFSGTSNTQLNLFPDRSTSDRLQQHGVPNRSAIEDGAEQDFPMHPLLFQHPREVHSSYNHPIENLNSHSRGYDLFPFEKVQVEKSNNQTTDGMEGAPVNTNTIGFHPLLQRTEAEMHGEAPEEDCHQSDSPIREPPMDDQLTVREASTSPREREEDSIDLLAFANLCERENNIDLHIHLCSSMSSIRPEGSLIASITNLEPINSYHHGVAEPREEAMQGIVMEQEELTDSEEDIQHVEFECEEMEDSEEEQAQDAEPRSTKNKVVKQGASRKHKSHGSSSQRSGRTKLRPERGRGTGSRTRQRSSTSRTSEPSQAKTRRTKGHQEGAGVERKSSGSRRSRKRPGPG
ncbi:unnamed protein product [Alopecurus aequalis]